jgi:hypothetical protein
MSTKMKKILGPVIGASLIMATVSPALAEDGDAPDDVEEIESEADGLEVEIDRPTVMLGDPIEVEASYEVETDDGDDDADGDESDTDDQGDTHDQGDTDTGDTDDGDADAAADAGAPEDGTAGTSTVPTSVSFSVDYGDGTSPEELTVVEQESDADEFEAEAEGAHVFAAEGTYTVSVTATPDVGDPVTVSVDVTVTSDPVAYPRDPETACPEGVAAASDFSDVTEGSTHEDAIDCLAGRGVVQGVDGTAFAPGATVVRAQMATLIVRMLEEAGLDLPEEVEDAFDDDDGSVHEQAINKLAALGLVNGSETGEFSPKAPLTRAQMAALLARALEAFGIDLQSELDYFADDDGSVHEGAINDAAAGGVATGRKVLEFAPGEQLTRAQLATFVARALDIMLDQRTASA